MNATFTLPSGVKVTTRTKRDFALIVERTCFHDAYVEQRSDSTRTLICRAERMIRAGTRRRLYVGDTSTGKLEEIRR